MDLHRMLDFMIIILFTGAIIYGVICLSHYDGHLLNNGYKVTIIQGG